MIAKLDCVCLLNHGGRVVSLMKRSKKLLLILEA